MSFVPALFTALMVSIPVRPGMATEVMKIGGTGGVLATMEALAAAYQAEHPGGAIEVLPSIGSGGGIRAVHKGAISIGLSSRPLSEDEKSLGLMAVSFAKTPFVFITHHDCACPDLNEDVLVSIFNGDMRNWPAGRRIRLVLRPPKDGDINIVRSISKRVAGAVDTALATPGMITSQTDQDAVDAVETIPGAFGFTSYSLLVAEKRSVKIIPYSQAEPSVEHISSGAYPLIKTFRLISRKRPGERTEGFIDFVFSPAGAKVLRENGCLPVARLPESR